MKALRFKAWLVLRMNASGRRLLSLPSIVAIGGLAIAIACMTLAMGVVSGFEGTLRSSVIDVFGHVLLVRVSQQTSFVEKAFDQIRAIAPEVKAYTPFIQFEGVIAKDGRIAGVAIQGVEPQSVETVLRLRGRAVAGKFDLSSLDGAPAALIGKGIAKRFKLRIGDSLNVILPTPSPTNASEFKPRAQAFRIRGVLDLGKSDYDDRYVLVDLKAAQALGRAGDGFSGVRLRLESADQARDVAARLQKALGREYRAMDWYEVNKNLFEAVAFERPVIFFVLLTMLVAASFNVSSNLFVSVLQRYPDLSILKAMGFSRRDAVVAFGMQGLAFGALGTALGLAVGVVFAAAFDVVQNWIELLPADVYKINRVSVMLRPIDVAWIVAASLAICVAASLAPAFRGSKLNPVEGLRYE